MLQAEQHQDLRLCIKHIAYDLFTLILPESKVISLCCSIEPGQPTHPCSLTMLYTVGRSTSSCHLDIPENDSEQFQKWNVDYSI